MAILNHGSTIRTADGGQSTTTIVTASNIGTYGVAANSTYFIGTTQNVFNRASGAQTLTGVSIDGNAANITAYTINQNVGTGNTPSFAGLVSSAVTNYAFLQVTDTNNFWITPGNNNWGLYFETSAGGLLGGTGDSNRLGFVGAGAARFYVDLNNGNGWFGASLTANTDVRAPIFYDSANTAYYLDAANSGTSLLVAGNVGIGTTSPSAKLHVAGTCYISDYLTISKDLGFPISTTSAYFGYSPNASSSAGSLLELVHSLSGAIGANDPLRFRAVSLTQESNDGITYTTEVGPPAYSNLLNGNASSFINVFTFDEYNSGIRFKRFVVDLGAQYRRPNFITIQSDYGGNNFYGYTILIEKSVDNSTWTTACSTQTQPNSNSRVIAFNLGDLFSTRYIRFTFGASQAITSGGALTINCIRSYSNQNYSSEIPVFTDSSASLYSKNATYLATIAGNVGIGSTSPSQKLHVVGTGFASADFRAPIFYDSDNTTYYLDPANTGTSLLVAGKVGIGITSPLLKLQVDAAPGNPATTGTTQNGIFRISNSTDNAVLDFGMRAAGAGAWLQSTDETSLAANYPLLLNPNGANVGINNLSADTNLQVVGHIHVGNQTTFENTGGWNKTIYLDGTYHARLRILGSAYASGKNSQTETYLWVDNTVSPYSGLVTNAGSFTINAGFTTLTNSARSPIFYDSDNTSYYLDAASTSSFNALNLASTLAVNGGDGIRVFKSPASSITSQIYWANGANTIAYNWQIDENNNAAMWGYGGTAWAKLLTVTSGGGVGIGTSTISQKLNISGNIMVAPASSSWAEGLSFTMPTASTWGGLRWRREVANNDGNHYVGYTGLDSTDDLVFGSNNAGTQINNNIRITKAGLVGIGTAPSQKFHVSGIGYSDTDFRAPLFYDSNDTNYYVDPASTTNLLTLSVNRINNLRPYVDTWHTSTDGTRRFYFANGGTTYYSTGNNYVFRNASDVGVVTIDGSGNLRTSTSGDNYASYSLHVGGTGFATADFRSPIFYDSNNTSYYVDPASTSNLNTITVNDVLTYGVIAAKSFSVSVNTSTYWTVVRPNGSSIATGYIYRITLCTTGTGTDTGEQYLLANVDSAGWVIKTVTKTGSGSNWPYVFLDAGVPKVKTDHASLYIVTVLVEELNSGNTGGLPSVFGLAGLFTSDNGTPKYRAGWFSSDNTLLHSGNYNSYSPTLTGTGASGSWGINITGSSASSTGNAATATTLQTARNINGTSFNGSAAITTATWGTARTLTIGSTGKSVDGSAAVSWSLGEIGALPLAGGTMTGDLRFNQGTGFGRIAYSDNYHGMILRGIPSDALGNVTVGDYTSLIQHSGDFRFYRTNGSINELYFQVNATAPYWRTNVILHAANYSTYSAFTSSLTSTVDVRGPIFYDSNDTAYYLDPANTTLSLKTRSSVMINNASAPNNYAMLNIGYNGAGETRAIDIQGGWSGGENKSITFTHASGSANIVAQINAQHNGPASRLRWGKLYHGGDSSTYTMELISESTTSAYLTVAGSVRAPIFYDSNDTTYYVDPASTSLLNTLRLAGSLQNNGSVSDDDNFGIYWDSGGSSAYAIYREAGSWTNPFPDLRIAFHTGIKIGANAGYNGVRFYDDYGMANQVMSVNNSSDGLGANNVYVNNALQAGGSLRAPIFYDSNDTTYYVDPNSLSNIRHTIFHIGSNLVGATGVGVLFDGNYTTGQYRHRFRKYDDGNGLPLYIDYASATANSFTTIARFGGGGTYNPFSVYGTADASGDFRAPIFYDSNNTAYYLDPASTSVLNTATISTVQTNAITKQTNGSPITINSGLNASTGLRVYYDMQLYNTLFFTTSGWGEEGRIYGSSSTVTIQAATATTTFVKYAGYSQEGGSFRAPIFYDSDNTSYYVDPASTSIMQYVRATNFHDSTGTYNVNLGSGNSEGRGLVAGYSGGSYGGIGYNVRHTTTGGSWIAPSTDTSTYLLFSNGIYFYYAAGGAAGRTLSYSTIGSLTSAGIFTVSGDVRAPLFYDSSNTAYYLDPASTSNLNVLNAVSSTTLWVRSGSWAGDLTSNGFTREIGMQMTGGSEFVILSKSGQGYTLVDGSYYAYEAGGFYSSFNSSYGAIVGFSADSTTSVTFNCNVKAPIFYDSANTAYYVDPASTSNLNAITAAGNITAAQYYSGGWFRNSTSGNGLYNESTTQHFYSDSTNYWNVASSAGAQGIRLRTGGHNGTVRGYFYADTNNHVGFLNQDGNWRLRVVGGDYSLADGSSMRAQIFYDSNDTNYYCDPNGTSSLVAVNANAYYPHGGVTESDIYARSLAINAYHHGDSLTYDTFQFNAASTYETRATVGSSFVSGTVETSIFKGDRFGGMTIANGVYQVRWTWNNTIGYKFFKTLYIANSTNGNSFTVTIESSANGSTWTTIATTGAMSNWPGHSWYNYFWNNNATIGYIRITVTPTWVNANTMDIYSMRYFCSYSLDAGSRLYDWDYSKNVTFAAAVSSPIFYDSNNTAYFIDGAGTSNLLGLTVTNTITGSITGNAGGSSASCTGNAATATTLQTARNINGTSFNGSANITTASWGTARTITIGSTGKSVDGSGNVAWSLAEIGAAATNQTMFIGTTSVAINRASASQTLSGISIDGNAATVTAGVYTNVNNTLTGINYFTSNLGTTSGSLSNPPLQAYASGTNAAFMSFHRGGSYAVNMGLDSDNVLRIGGWSASANRLQLDMSGNLTLAGVVDATQFRDSSNTAYFIDPASTSNLVGLTVANTITGSITGNAGGSSASCSGNAATATILQTARTIGGVSFNGSANINLPGVNTAGNQNTTGTAANVTGTVAIANGGTGATTAAAARSNLGIPAAETSSNQSLSGSTTCTIDVAAANVHILALASGTTISSFTYNNRSASPLVNTILVVLKFAGTATVTWSNVVWSNGTTPTLTGVNGKADVYSLTSYKGGTTGPAWIGSVVGQNMDSTNL